MINHKNQRPTFFVQCYKHSCKLIFLIIFHCSEHSKETIQSPSQHVSLCCAITKTSRHITLSLHRNSNKCRMYTTTVVRVWMWMSVVLFSNCFMSAQSFSTHHQCEFFDLVFDMLWCTLPILSTIGRYPRNQENNTEIFGLKTMLIWCIYVKNTATYQLKTLHLLIYQYIC